MAGKSFGNAPAAPSSPSSSSYDPATSEGLANISERDGAIAAVAAAAERTRRTGIASDVTITTLADGREIVTLAKDATPRDPRTQRQKDADLWLREAGLSDPHPTHTRRKP